MHGVSLTRFIIGVIGNVISALLFISPVPTYLRILKEKSTEEFHPYPYLATVMNCVLWIFYGLPIVHPDSTLVISINSFGLAVEIIYLTIFFIYTSKKYRKTILLFILGEIVLFAIIAVITLLCFHTTVKRSMFVGIICDVFGIIMYASPLSIVRRVYKTKSAEYLPIWLCLCGLCNGVIWFTYANLKTFDYYIAIGNGIGGVFGLIQVCVWCYYTLRTMSKKGGASEVKPGEVQLQKTSSPV